jgi:hypothetical protein
VSLKLEQVEQRALIKSGDICHLDGLEIFETVEIGTKKAGCPADWTDIVTLIQITAKAKMNDIQKDRFEIFSIILLHSSTK